MKTWDKKDYEMLTIISNQFLEEAKKLKFKDVINSTQLIKSFNIYENIVDEELTKSWVEKNFKSIFPEFKNVVNSDMFLNKCMQVDFVSKFRDKLILIECKCETQSRKSSYLYFLKDAYNQLNKYEVNIKNLIKFIFPSKKIKIEKYIILNRKFLNHRKLLIFKVATHK